MMREGHNRLEDRLDIELSRLERPEEYMGIELEGRAEDPLRPLLSIVSRLRTELRPPEPDPDFARNSEIRVLNQIKAQFRSLGVSAASPRKGLGPTRLLRVSAFVGVLLMALLFTSFGLIPASASALPGDGLYPVKRGLEAARLALTFDAPGKEALMIDFSTQRFNEIVALSDAGRTKYLDQAVRDYTKSIDQLAAEIQSVGHLGVASSSTLDSTLAHNAEVLQAVLAKVPAQAKPAIQKAIDRSVEKLRKEKKLQPGGNTQPGQDSQEPKVAGTKAAANRERPQAEQMARQYGVSPDEVLSVFQGICQEDWKCVRDHYRKGEGGGSNPNK
jgi:hypothetical protein